MNDTPHASGRNGTDTEHGDDDVDLTETEARQVDRRQTAASRVVHEVIRRQGDEELQRPALSLMWSGLAGGIGISASVMGMGLIHQYLPEDAPWGHAVASLGYPLGFLIVILGRLQLFTESTLSAVIPVATSPSAKHWCQLARLWSIVFASNVFGTLLVAAMIAGNMVGRPDGTAAMIDVSRNLLELSPFEVLTAGVPAGFLMAAVAWALPTGRRQEFFVIYLFTYFIALGGFAHVVAGSAEAWLLLFAGEVSPGWVLAGFLLPALIGNVLGGSVLFALLAHAQVRGELHDGHDGQQGDQRR